MKKTVKRVVALMLVLTLALSLAACKKDDKKENSTTGTTSGSAGTTKKEYTKPSKITVMWDGTILKEGDEYTDQLYAAYDEAYGIDIEWIRPDHSSYAKVVTQTFASTENLPDAFMLSADKYVSFAARGLLYDMSEDWEQSSIRDDGRFSDLTLSILETYYVEGRNGDLGLYGLPTTRGNGCLTYVRKSWLDAIGKKAEDIKTYQDYYNMIVAMKEAGLGEYVVTGSGYISSEAPYTNYLPEFYQDAYPDFMQDENGKWIDGFQTEEMKEALERLRLAQSAGLLDPNLGSNTTTNARNNFYAGKCGVFTYWAGTWMQTIANNIIVQNPDAGYEDEENGDGLNYGDVVALAPIKEVGQYIERMAPCVCINKNAENPAGIYKYFVEPIYDGGDVMTVWMYGAKGTQWDNKAETVVIKDVEYTYKEGEFHFLANKKGAAFISKNNIDPNLALCAYKEGKDPAGNVKNASTPMAVQAQELFNKNCVAAPALVSNNTLASNNADINNKRKEIAAKVINGEVTYEKAMEEYQSSVGEKIQYCLDSLNEE